MVNRRAPLAVLAIALVCLAGACASGGTAAHDGIGLRHAYWRADERVLITDFSMIAAVAAGPSFAFAAGPHGVAVYDHRFRAWQAPLTVEDGFPRADLPVELEVDELAGVLWMATRAGALWAYDVSLEGEWRRVGTLPGGPPVELVAWDGALWARTGSGWFQSSAVGGAPVRARPPADVERRAGSGLDALERESAGFRATGSSLTVDEWLRRWQITSAAPGREPSRWFLGTWGGGLYAYDDRMLDAQPLRFGSVGRGVSAIAESPGGTGFWFGGDGMSERRGVARADHELQRWTWFVAGRDGAPSGPVHAIAETPMGVFVAAADGLYRRDDDRWDRLTDGDALPSTRVRSLEAVGGVVWAGTDRGLARITASSGGLRASRIDGTTGLRVEALAARDSTLWIGTDRGLLSLHLRTGALAQPPLDDARLRGRIVGIARDSLTLYVLAESTLLVYDGAHWTAPPPPASIAAVGRPTHIAARDGIVWITGSTGALGFDPATGAETVLSVPRDIPEGPVRQVLPIDGGVWFATPAGALLVRFE